MLQPFKNIVKPSTLIPDGFIRTADHRVVDVNMAEDSDDLLMLNSV